MENCILPYTECCCRIWTGDPSCNLDMVDETVCFCHVTYAFQSGSTLYSCVNVKEVLARSKREI